VVYLSAPESPGASPRHSLFALFARFQRVLFGDFFQKLVNAAHRADQPGFPGVKRMTGGASLGFKIFL